jgi:hypothetical protein
LRSTLHTTFRIKKFHWLKGDRDNDAMPEGWIGIRGMSVLKGLRRGYQAMAREVGPRRAATIAFGAALFALALCLGGAGLIGIRKADAMFDSGQVQRAFEAVKRRAGPRMLVRTLEITPRELTVWAMDPDMSPWRFVPATRQHGSHTVFVPGVFEQSWRVTHWTVFRRDWYWVSGPEPEGIIEQDRGDAFDLKPDDIPDLPALAQTATRSAAGDAQVTSITLDSRKTTAWVNSPAGLSHVSLQRQGG